VGYGSVMAGNRDEGEAGPDWLAPLFAQMQAKIQKLADELCKEKPEGVAETVKVVRALGVVARSACAVDALRRRAAACSKEDEMGGRTYDPAEDERIRQKLLVESARIDRIIESKRARGSGGREAEAGRTLAGDAGAPVPA
jgi:hypothetical protein